MIFKAPESISYRDSKPTIFLAGSIEQGKAEPWQEEMSKFFAAMDHHVFNPRREEWDSSWEHSPQNPQFYQQVMWEQTALEQADFVFFYFDPNTKSPITLLELGQCLGSRKRTFVVCPEGYWRRGNVQMMCDLYAVRFFDSLTSFKEKVLKESLNIKIEED